MSHRTRNVTDIKNRELATQALKNAGWNYSEQGNNVLLITSGPLNRASLDLNTGDLIGDSDWRHSQNNISDLRRHYSEALVRHEALKTGASIESREVLKNGDIRLVLTANFA